MSLLGIHLTLLIGPTVPVPAPTWLLEAIDGVEIKTRATEASGFQLTFRAGRAGPLGLMDYKLLSDPLLKTGNRIVLVVTFSATPRVLMDGVITRQQLNPSNEPGATTVTVDGIDLTAVMGREQREVEHLGLPDAEIVRLLISRYARFGLIPTIVPPRQVELSLDKVKPQRSSDLEFIRKLAGRHGHIFYIRPGPAPLVNTAYWGPPVDSSLPQKALSMNLGGETNVGSMDFQYDAEKAKAVNAKVKDPAVGMTLPVSTSSSLRLPLALASALDSDDAPKALLESSSGLGYTAALARAQGATDTASDEVLTATGELDAARYGAPLEARRLVGVRGAGYRYDGLYFVKEVTHEIHKGDYKQRFTLTRGGLGSTTPVVPV